MKRKSWRRIFAGYLAIYVVGPTAVAYANSPDYMKATAVIGQNSYLCNDIQNQIDKFTDGVNPQNWTQKLYLSGLKWPTWLSINPTQNMGLIKKAVTWPHSREFYSSWTDEQYVAFWGTKQAQDAQWDQKTKKVFVNAENNGQLQVESTNVHFSMRDNAGVADIVRFRIYNPLDINYQFRNWEYVIRSVAHNNAIKNIPVSMDSAMTVGELGIIGPHIVIFETGNDHGASLSEILILSSPSNEDQYHAIGVINSCNFQFQ